MYEPRDKECNYTDMQKQKAYSVRELKGKEVHRELVLVHYFKPQMHICQYLLVIQHL